jgi:hypothetical protein
VRQALEEDGLWAAVDQSRSLFLTVGYMFAHVVLNDASKYEKALDALRRLHIQLKAKHQEFEWMLRSTWQIASVEHRGPYYDEDGNIYAATDIQITLKSGPRVNMACVRIQWRIMRVYDFVIVSQAE